MRDPGNEVAKACLAPGARVTRVLNWNSTHEKAWLPLNSQRSIDVFVLRQKKKATREKNTSFDNTGTKIEERWHSTFNSTAWICVWSNVRGFLKHKTAQEGRPLQRGNDIDFFARLMVTASIWRIVYRSCQQAILGKWCLVFCYFFKCSVFQLWLWMICDGRSPRRSLVDMYRVPAPNVTKG